MTIIQSGEGRLTREADCSFRTCKLGGPDTTISVLVTCFNYRHYIEEAINSVLTQSFSPSEIIVIDDGSSDGSLEILKQRFGSIKNMQIVTTPNRGQLAAICEGFLRLASDAVALLDADDTWDPNYLQRVSDQFSQNASIDFVAANVKCFGAKGGIWNKSTQDTDHGLTSCLTSLSDPPPWIGSPTSGLSIRKTFFEKLIPTEDLYVDWKTRADDCLVLGSSILGAHKFYIAETLVNYRIHGSNNWASQVWSADNACRYEIKKQKMLNYYRNKAYGSGKPSVHILHFEFKSTPRPSLTRLWKYLGMLPKTNGMRRTKFIVAFMITKYWWKQLFQKT